MIFDKVVDKMTAIRGRIIGFDENDDYVGSNTFSKESGSGAFMFYFLLIPILFLVMGFGMQVSMNQYAKTTLQSGLEHATQAALAASIKSGTSVSISSDILPKIRTIYDTNRNANVFGLTCTDLPAAVGAGTVITPPSGCQYREVGYKVLSVGGYPTLRYEITDYTSNMFAQIMGTDAQTYNLYSEARITFTNR